MTSSDRIVIDPEVHHGRPDISGTRISVTTVVGSLAGGMTFEEVHDIRAALKFAARYGSASETIRASLRLLEEYERRIGTLRDALIEGERSEFVELDMHEIKRKARRRAKPGD